MALKYRSIESKGPKVVCSGFSHVSGHPKVYLAFNSKGQVCCPYCNQSYHHHKKSY